MGPRTAYISLLIPNASTRRVMSIINTSIKTCLKNDLCSNQMTPLNNMFYDDLHQIFFSALIWAES